MAMQHPRDMREWMASMERRVREASRNGNRVALSAAQKEAGIVRDQIEAINNLTPTAPIELTYQTALYINRDGKTRARFFLQFPDVIKATDGTDIIVDHYELFGRREGVGNHYSSFPGHLTPGMSYPGAPGVTAFKGTLPALTHVAFSEESQFRVEDFNPGDAWRFRVRAFANIGGKPGVWSIEVVVNFDVDTTPPPQPTVPVVTASRGQLIVEVDGQSVNGPMPPDHAYTILAGGLASAPTQEIYRFSRQGGTHVITGLDYYEPYFLRLQAVDESGNHGPWSEQAVGIPTPLVDEDVILSKIDAGETLIENAGEILLSTGQKLTAKLSQADADLQASRDRLAVTEQNLNVTFPSKVQQDIATAKQEALTAAALDADAKAEAAEQAAISAAAADATAKMEQAEADAAADALAKANQALADAKADATAKANAAEEAAITAAALDATAKAEAAEADAVAAAAITAQQKADTAKQEAITASNSLAIELAKGADDRIVNGSFEADREGYTGTPGSSIIDTTKARTGTKSWKTTGSGEIIQPGFAVTVGDTWRYEWYYQTDANWTSGLAGGLRLQKSTDGGATYSDAASTGLSLNTNWTRQQVEYVVPAGVTHIRARVAFAYAGGHAAWVDDLRLLNITSIKALEADAQAKANAAEEAAIAAAALDATAKKEEAEANAAADASTKANQALADAQADATTKANDAEQAAITAAALDATAKAEQAEADAIAAAAADATAKADQAQADAEAAAAIVAQAKADAAKEAAIDAAAVDAQTKADAAAAVGQKALDSARSYINPATSLTDILTKQGVAPTTIASPGAMGGIAIRKSGTGNGWWEDRAGLQAIDPELLYRFTARVRVVTPSTLNGKGFYFGAVGFADEGETYVNNSGANSYSSQQWSIQNSQIRTDGVWVDFIIYYKGISAGAVTGNGTLTTPRTFHSATRWFCPGMILDYSSGNGTWEMSHWSVDAIDPIGHQALLDAATAQTKANEAHTLAGTAESNAQSALTMAGSKSKVFYNTTAPTGTANVNDTWRQVDGSGNVIAEWRWTTPGWTSQQVTSQMISNLDVGKLTVGTGVISQLVAQHIAAHSGEFIELDVSQLRATTGTIETAVIDKLWADVVNSREITTNMLLVGSGENLWVDQYFESSTATIGAIYTGAEVAPRGSIRTMKVRDHVASSTTQFEVVPGDTVVVEYTAKRVAGARNLRATVWLYAPNGSGVTSPFAMLSYISEEELIGTVDANGWGRYRSTSKIPEARTDVGKATLYFQIDQTAGAYDTEWLVSDVRLRRGVESEVIVDGSITTRKLTVTEDMTVALLAAHKVQAGEIEVNTLFADATFTGSLNTHVATFLTNEDGTGHTSTVTGQGLKVIYTDPVTGEVQDRVKIGTFDDDYIALTDDVNETSVSIDKTGTGAFRSLNVRDSITLNGIDLDQRLRDMPQGMAAWGQLQINSNMSTTTEVGLFEIGWEAMVAAGQPERMYEFNVNPFLINQTQPGIVGLRLRYTTDGSAPTVNSPVIGYSYWNAPGAGLSTTGQFTRIIGSNNGPYIRVLLCLYDDTNGVTSVYGPGTGQTHLYCTVKDLGATMLSTVSATTGGGSVYTGSTVAAPTNPTVTYTKEWGYNGVRSYLPSGAHYNYNTSKAYQGQSPAGYGNLNSMYTFPSVTSLLSGATINDVWVYLYFEHWYYNSGGTAEIRLHNNLSVPASYSGMTTNGINSTSWPKGAGRWVRLPSGLYDGFKTGAYRGFGLVGDGYISYGIANNARLKIKYTK